MAWASYVVSKKFAEYLRSFSEGEIVVYGSKISFVKDKVKCLQMLINPKEQSQDEQA